VIDGFEGNGDGVSQRVEGGDLELTISGFGS
jgi:hypothetical protein